MLENYSRIQVRLARVAGLLGAAIVTSGCGTANGVLQTYPSNAAFNGASSTDSGRIREITLWKGTTGDPQSMRVGVWCEPHQGQQNGFSAGSCAFSILLEDYERPRSDGANAKTPQEMQPLAEQFADCAASPDKESCRQRRNVLQSFLIKTARANCTSYLRRLFAVKEIGDTSVSVLKDTLTGGSVIGAAAGSPPVAGALGLLNLLSGTYSNVDSAMFQGATARVLADAIEQAQAEYLSSGIAAEAPAQACTTSGIASGSSYADCDVFQLLDFANGYAAACSLRNGLGVLEASVSAREADTKGVAANRTQREIAQLKATLNTLRSEVQSIRPNGAVQVLPAVSPSIMATPIRRHARVRRDNAGLP